MSKGQTPLKLSVVIPTFGRAKILAHVLSALSRQSYRSFNVIVVVKPSGDDTEKIVEEFKRFLDITTVIQKNGYIVDAYFLGVRHSTGDVVAFLDDDAIPSENWVEETVNAFERYNVAAVTGDAFSAVLRKDGKIHILEEEETPSTLSRTEYILFGRPLKGMEDYKNCITDSGLVYQRGSNAYSRKRGIVKALPRGPSMAVSGKILRELEFPTDWILGCAWEMVLGWYLWKRDLRMIYDPDIKVFHLIHGRTASRDFLNPRTDLLWAVEAELLLFYRLYFDEPQLSMTSKLVSDLARIAHSLKYLRTNPIYQIRKIEGILIANIMGNKWLISKMFGRQYSPLRDLEKLQRPR